MSPPIKGIGSARLATEKDIEHAYALFLNRTPESDSIVDEAQSRPLSMFLDDVISSREFTNRAVRPVLIEGAAHDPTLRAPVATTVACWARGAFRLGAGPETAGGLALLAAVIARWSLDLRSRRRRPMVLAYVAERLAVSAQTDDAAAAGDQDLRRPQVERLLNGSDDEVHLALRALRLLDSGAFDATFYRAGLTASVELTADPLGHYLRQGDREGRAPNRFFQPDVHRAAVHTAETITALEHYLQSGRFGPLERAGLTRGVESAPPGAALLRAMTAPPPTGGPWERLRRGLDRVDPPPTTRRMRARRVSDVVEFVAPTAIWNGLGTSARGYLRLLQAAGVEVAPVSWRLGLEHHSAMPAPPGSRPFTGGGVTVVHLNFDALRVYPEEADEIFSRSSYTIGIIYWELPVLFPQWMEALARFDEIWCPSEFIRDLLAAAAPVRTRLIRPLLSQQDSRPCPPVDQRRRPYFFYALDSTSGFERKNPFALVDAFKKAFRPGKGPGLVLKVGVVDEAVPQWQALRRSVADRPDIEILRDHLPPEAVGSLMKGALAYVSPHRSEGVGMALVEAMQLGTPLIATGFGGSTDFATDETSEVIPYRLIEVGTAAMQYVSSALWADPDVDVLAAMLRKARPGGPPGKAELGRARAEMLFGAANVAVARQVFQALGVPPRPPAHDGAV